MYHWDETVAKRCSNKVVSCLYHYFTNILSEEIKTLYLYSDGSGGQNKNHVMVYFLHSLVKLGYFDKIVHIFPLRGHSFLPCDRDFASIELKKRRVETLYVPDQWIKIIESSRVTNPFTVVRVTQDMIIDFTSGLAPYFKKNLKNGRNALKFRSVRVFEHNKTHDVLVRYSMSALELPIAFTLEKPRVKITMPTEYQIF